MNQEESTVIVLGSEAQSGAYILRLAVDEPLSLAFGRFRGGELLTLPAGIYLYVGSAMAEKGASSLARRLVRHATRSERQSPHPIRAEMVVCFQALRLGSGDPRPQRKKSLFWHVDYLLDQRGVRLTHVLVVRAQARLETALADLLHAQPYTTLPFEGLGASDVPHGTHLFLVRPTASWWCQLQTNVRSMI